MLEKVKIETELCVVGGGMAGICTAISAAREGIKVVLMHERPMLGGNASSEIRIWICGARGRNNKETGIIEEIALENMRRNPTKSYAVWDTLLYDFVKREKNITLLLNCTCMNARAEKGNFDYGRDIRIKTVMGYQMTAQRFIEVEAKYFADCSGDSILAPLSGAEYKMGREGKDEWGEDVQIEVEDSKTMGMSCLVYGRETQRQVDYFPPSYAKKLTKADFENREPDIYNDLENFWYLELGGNEDSIKDTEEIRDELLSLATGTWDYVKNSGEYEANDWDLDFIGFLPGKRESRRMTGEYIVTQRDISGGVVFEDEIAYGGWPLDDHFPDGFYHKGVPNTDYKTPAPYSLPYRMLYSKNVDNLFFAGRNVSMTHMAMSSIRVMATCALLGEAVGKAVSVAIKDGLSPHGVYSCKIKKVQELLQNGDCFLPHVKREVSEACKSAILNGACESIRRGEDRTHELYKNEKEATCIVKKGESVSYKFPKMRIKCIRIVFDSDLNRETLDGSECERHHGTRANVKLNEPKYHLPTTLCKSFTLSLQNGTESNVVYSADCNVKRSHYIKIDGECDGIILTLLETWGGRDVPLISFDFA